MKIGDLVKLSVEYFDIPSSAIGIVSELDYKKVTGDSAVWKNTARVYWVHNELYPSWVHCEDLKVLSRKKHN